MKYFVIIFSMLLTVFATAQESSVYELRTYTTNEGKLDALNARFRDHTVALLAKHGMISVGYWMPVDKPNTLIYILKHDSVESGKKSWQNFIADPAWQIIAEESNRNGQILAAAPVSVYMTETDYSQLGKR